MSGVDGDPSSSTRIPGLSLAAVGVTSFGGEGFQLGQLSPGADTVAHAEGVAARLASEEQRWQKAMDDLRASGQQSPEERRDPTWLPGNENAGAASDGESGGEEDEGGRFCDFVTLLNPDAAQHLGTRFRLARDLLSAAETAKAELRQLLTGDGLAGRVTLTTDIWTSENNVAFMVVTAHRVTSDFQLQQMVIDFRPLEGRHTGDKIASELEEVIGEWALGGGEFFGLTTDNAENNNRAIRLLAGVPDDTPGSRPRVPPLMSLARHFKCVAHVLNLAVQYATKVEPVAEALRRLRAVASYIGWSVQRSERFFDIQKRYAATLAETQAGDGAEEGGERQAEGGTVERGGTQAEGGSSARKRPTDLRLIVDSDTRWGSTLEMVVRGCELSIPLTMYFDESSVPNITKTTRTAWAEIMLSDAHWTALNELRAFLEPFDRITLFVEGSLYPTMGSVVPQYNMLLDILEANRDSPDVSQLCMDLSKRALSKLERHMGRVSEECAITTFLDPRLKTATFGLRARGARPSAPIVVEAGGHARGARTLDLTEERVKALVRKRLPPYQIAARAAAEARLGGEVTSARGVTGEGAARSGAAGRRGARSRGVLDGQASLFAELAEMEAEEGVRAQDEVDQYLAEARQEGGCALAYWRGRELQLPGLRAMARDYLGIPATSAASERAFSQSRNIIWWQRHRLSPQQMRAAMMIKTWQEHHPRQRLDVRVGRATIKQLCLEAEQLGL
ncbi:unnamed protein product [Closterium sp. Naga37s-1]|nr:unnamed protein product [Closterium sp. Naga37s-1]